MCQVALHITNTSDNNELTFNYYSKQLQLPVVWRYVCVTDVFKIMQTINSGNRKFYVIHFIYFSSMETDINFLLVFSLLGSWSVTLRL